MPLPQGIIAASEQLIRGELTAKETGGHRP
jgi:hypothetical protein